MKTLKESLFSRKNIENSHKNPYGISKDKFLYLDVKDVPLGILIKMFEEYCKQRNIDPNHPRAVKEFYKSAGFSTLFTWISTDEGYSFWKDVINHKYDIFFERYPEYEIYN